MSFNLPELPNGWTFKTLDSVTRKGSITYGIVQPGTQTDGGVPIIRVNNFRDTSIDVTDVMKVSPEIAEKYERTCLQGGEVLLTIVGTVGQVAVAPKSVAGFNVARAVAVINPLEDIGAEWIALCLRSPFSQHLLGSRANTTVQITINLKDLRALPIPFPPKAERKLINELISSLDDRITLLRENSAALEGIAQALFKSWFVDFDPVSAKLEGRKPEGMDEATAALFPDSFEQGELGEIPKGWKISNIGSELTSILGGTPSRARPEFWKEGTVAWINSGKVNEFRITTASELITEEALSKSATKLLPSRTTVLAITGATLGQISIVEIAACANQSVIGILQNEKFSTEFIYFWINFNIKKLISSQTGGAQQHINKGNVEELPLLVPDIQTLNRFKSIAQPLFIKIAENCFQISTLSSIRDSLLPRLISGQLRLPDSEVQVETITA